jgi:hypothetical protein
LVDEKNDAGGERAARSEEAAAVPPARTIHEAEMKFFTPDLIERFGSDDDRIAPAAQTELEQSSEAYSRRLSEVASELPQRFQELLDRYYLHDARVIDHSFLGNGISGPLGGPASSASITGWKSAERALRRLISFWMVLELDTPPRELLALQYRSVLIEGVDIHQALREDECPYLEWQYDEVELINSGRAQDFRHSILFTKGLELRLRFKDFDFTTLKPIVGIAEFAEDEEAQPWRGVYALEFPDEVLFRKSIDIPP